MEAVRCTMPDARMPGATALPPPARPLCDTAPRPEDGSLVQPLDMKLEDLNYFFSKPTNES